VKPIAFVLVTTIGAALFVISIVEAVAQGTNVSVSTLEWLPYTGSKLPKGGATTEVVRAAFKKVGFETVVVYRPWKRAIEMAKNGSENVVAYFPGYHCHHREGFVASEPIGSGPLGFAEHIEAPITWKDLDDIGEQKLKIGTVRGYANTDEFDAKVAAGRIRAIPINDDVTNLKKLMGKRIDGAVIDKLMFEYLKATGWDLDIGVGSLRFDEKPLENKTLYVCFRDDEQGRTLKHMFNAGLEGTSVESIVDD
jgi:polar amino acid transport system substrate-binding protein